MMNKLSERIAAISAYDGTDAIAEAVALTKEHETASGWRPIGKAPKDGSAVIVGAHSCDRWSWWTATWWTEHEHACAFHDRFFGARYSQLERFETRARRLLPLWRAEAIRRNRLWFALIGLGFDIEGDSLSDMTSREMLERIELSFRSERGAYARAKLRFILAELDR